jgi:hypothetical protein
VSGVVAAIIERADPMPRPNADRPWEFDNERVADIVRRAVGKDREAFWGSMIYACGGERPSPTRSGCGFEHRVWLGVGVEGPPELKAADLMIPCPMFCGTCPDCGGVLFHDRWNEDEEFDLTWELPAGTAAFVVPGKGTLKRHAEQGYWGAEYRKGDRA